MILILISCKPYIAMVLGYKKRFSLNSSKALDGKKNLQIISYYYSCLNQINSANINTKFYHLLTSIKV